jgi:hypothetical protein
LDVEVSVLKGQMHFSFEAIYNITSYSLVIFRNYKKREIEP